MWQCLAPTGTGAQPSEKAELTKTHQVSWPGHYAGLLSLSTMPLQHVGHEEEVELNHSSALESRSKPSLPPPVRSLHPSLQLISEELNSLPKFVAPLSPPAASILWFTSGSVHTPPWPERSTTHFPDLMSSLHHCGHYFFKLNFLKTPTSQLITTQAAHEVDVS